MNLKFSAVDFDIPKISNNELILSGKEWVYYGNDNKFPVKIYNLYQSNTVVGSVINGSSDYIIQNGYSFDENLTTDSDIENAILDLLIFGGFVLKKTVSKTNKLLKLEHIDIRRFRIDKTSKYAFILDNMDENVNYEWLGPKAIIKKYNIEDFIYYKGKSRMHYPIPDWFSALRSAETLVELQEFHYKLLKNGFVSNAIINFNNGIPSDEVRKDIENKINNKFTGAQNGGRLMISWNEDKDKATTIEQFADDEFDQKFTTLSDMSIANIFTTFRAHPQLFGMSTQTGFANIEYDAAFNLYNKSRIIPIQKLFEKQLKDVNLKFTNETDITINPSYNPTGDNSNAQSNIETKEVTND